MPPRVRDERPHNRLTPAREAYDPLTLGIHRARGLPYPARVVSALALACLSCWTSAIGCLWLNESRIVFRAGWSRGASSVELPAAFAPLHLRTADGIDLEATHMTHADPSPRYWILFCPSAGRSIRHPRLQAQLLQLHELGYNVLALDYRGFGRNAGSPSEAGLYEDASAAYRSLRDTMRVPASRIIVAGRSLGSAVAVELATRYPTAGLLLLSPIDSVPETGSRLYPWAPVRWLASYRFDAMAKIEHVSAPVVLAHATNDGLVPISVARRLLRKVSGPKLMIESRGGHNGAGFDPQDALGEALWRFWPAW